ncbi:MAG: ABC transporter permease [Candidatus Jordarchaeaceae archaeon]
MSFKSNLHFQLKRATNFIKLFCRSTKGIAGLIIILFFTFISFAGPILTPYSPTGEDPRRKNFPVAARMCAPEWIVNLPTFLGGNPTLSKTVLAIDNPGKPQLIQEGGEWNLTAPEELLNQGIITVKFNETVNYPYSGIPGSLEVAFERKPTSKPYGNVTVTIFKEFSWPYASRPGRYKGYITLLATGKTSNGTHLQVPVKVEVFLEQVEEKKHYDLWPPPSKIWVGRWTWMPVTVSAPAGFIVDNFGEDRNINPNPKKGCDVYIGRPENGSAQGWIISSNSYATNSSHIDSQSSELCNRGDLLFSVNTPESAFSKCPGTYRYGITITFRDWTPTEDNVQTKLFIDQFDLVMLGNSFGILGTDHLGRDLFSQLIYGARWSLYVGLLSAILGVVLGLIVGLAAGYLGKAVDEVLMRFSDMLLVLPSLPLLIVLVAILGSSLENLILILGLLGWMGFARLVRSQVLSLRERPFVEAAKAVGAGKRHILFRHILPNVMGLVYVSLATSVPGAIVAEAALSWLGFVDPYRTSWGKMLYEAQFEAQAINQWWWIVPPGLCISALALSFILLGFAIDDILNPKLRVRR